MKRLAIGAALGGAAVYFLDSHRGEDRRGRLQSLWRENRDTALDVQSAVAHATESMRPLVRRMKRGDWTEGGRTNWGLAVTGTIIAAAVGGAVVYFLDPRSGSIRRQRALSFLEAQPASFGAAVESARKAATAVKLGAKQEVDETSKAVEVVRANGRGRS